MTATTLEAVAAALDRIEQRQAAYETVALRILGSLDVHTEMLVQVIKACAPPSGPSPVQETLAGILAAMQQHVAALEALPGNIVQAFREDAEAHPDEDMLDHEGAGRWDPPG